MHELIMPHPALTTPVTTMADCSPHLCASAQVSGKLARLKLSRVTMRFRDLYCNSRVVPFFISEGARLSMSDSSLDASIRSGSGADSAKNCLLASNGGRLQMINSQVVCEDAVNVTGLTCEGGSALLQGVKLAVSGSAIQAYLGTSVLASKCSIQQGPAAKGMLVYERSKMHLTDCTVEGGTHGIQVVGSSGPHGTCMLACAVGACMDTACCQRLPTVPLRMGEPHPCTLPGTCRCAREMPAAATPLAAALRWAAP